MTVLDADLGGEPDGVAEDGVVRLRRSSLFGWSGLPWQERALISRPRLATASLNSLAGGVVAEQLRRLAVGVAGVGAAADLDRLAAGLLDVIERLLERALREEDREHADLHPSLLCEVCPRPSLSAAHLTVDWGGVPLNW